MKKTAAVFLLSLLFCSVSSSSNALTITAPAPFEDGLTQERIVLLCYDYGSLASMIMLLRQVEALTQEEMTAQAKNDIVKEIIKFAYDEPRRPTEEMRVSVAMDFGRTVAQACLATPDMLEDHE